MSFEALYQFLYTVLSHDAAFFAKNTIADDLLWLRVYKMDDWKLSEKLQETPYGKLCELFAPFSQSLQIAIFVAKLYDYTDPAYLRVRCLAQRLKCAEEQQNGRQKSPGVAIQAGEGSQG